jgi:hypothetical protein
MSSKTEWECTLYATIAEILLSVPFGETKVSVTSATFHGDQYGGKLLDFVHVLWKKCFL